MAPTLLIWLLPVWDSILSGNLKWIAFKFQAPHHSVGFLFYICVGRYVTKYILLDFNVKEGAKSFQQQLLKIKGCCFWFQFKTMQTTEARMPGLVYGNAASSIFFSVVVSPFNHHKNLCNFIATLPAEQPNTFYSLRHCHENGSDNDCLLLRHNVKNQSHHPPETGFYNRGFDLWMKNYEWQLMFSRE